MSDQLVATPLLWGLRSMRTHVELFAERLAELGYPPWTWRAKVRFAAQLARWAESHSVVARNLTERSITKALRPWRRVDPERGRAMLQFLEHLRDRGVVRRPAPERQSPAGLLEQRYIDYLRDERGLAIATLVNYRGFVRELLRERYGAGPVSADALTAKNIATFQLGQLRTMGPGRAKLLGTAMRSFLRFLFLEGETPIDLTSAVAMTRTYRNAAVPRHIAEPDVRRVLASCDARTAVGRRDQAVLLLLARLGLRAGEVVKLELDDIHWRSAELVVRGKGKLHDRLPLPKDVGAALARYLTTDRPRCTCRRVFLRLRAPVRGLASAAAVTTIVERAIDRTGLKPPWRGAHLLRHSLATDMIRRGATLGEIGQLLRHRSPATTEVYAKVDFEGLRGVALPWPGARGAR